MCRHRWLIALLSAAAVALGLADKACAGAWRCASPDCAIITSASPSAFRNASWTLLVQAYPAAASTAEAEMLTVPGVVELRLRQGAVQAVVFRQSERVDLSAPLSVTPGARLLLALSWDRSAGELTLRAASGSGPMSLVVTATVGWAQQNLGARTCAADIDGDGAVGPSDQFLLLGSYGPCQGACPADINSDGSVDTNDLFLLLASWGPCPGFAAAPGLTVGPIPGSASPSLQGDIGPIILRDAPITDDDFAALQNSDAFLAPIFLDTTSAGGALNGLAGVLFATAYGATASHGPGDLITEESVLLFDRAAGGGFMGRAPVVQIAGDWRHVSPYDEHGLSRTSLPIVWERPPTAPRRAPLVRQLATGRFTRQIRALVHGNSRVARIASDHGFSQSYAHGFVQSRPQDVVGWLLRPPMAPVGVGAWWGFSFEPDPPLQQGTVNLSTSDFSRFGQNSVTILDRGPGTAAGVTLGGFYRALTRPEPGLDCAEPLRAGAVLLQYPGSANALVHAVSAQSNSDPDSTLHATTPVWLDAQRFAYTFRAQDGAQTVQSPHYLHGSTISKTLLTIDAQAASNVRVGDAVYGLFGGRHSVSVVESIAERGDGLADVLLATELAGAPAAGDVLRFGPWAFTVIEHDLPPCAEGRSWRGVMVENAGGGGPGPVVVLGFNVYVPDKPGLVLTTFGAGGDGYRDHLEDEIPGAARLMAQILGVDAALLAPAQQHSTLEDMEQYVAQLRLGRPDIEVALVGDGAFNPTNTPGVEARSFFTLWNDGFLQRAGALGAVAVDGGRDERLGRFLDRVADGQMSNPSHQSSRGAARQAQAWLDLLAVAALPRAGDADGDGFVGPGDLFAVLGAWGVCPSQPLDPCLADTDGDGAVGPNDLFAVLANWGS